MAKQTINISQPNDGLGDPVRDAFDKTNDNFTEVYSVTFITTTDVTSIFPSSAQLAISLDTTPSLGGNLDVAGNSIVSTSNGNIPIAPDGTGEIQLDGLSWPTADGTANQLLKTNGSGQLSWETVTTGGLGSVSEDTTPSLGGNLDVAGNSIVSTSAGDITITPDTTGDVVLDGLKWPQADGTSGQLIKTDGAGQLSWETVATGGLGNVVEDTTPQLGGPLDVNGNAIVSASAGNITITPDTTGEIVLDGLQWPQADGTADQVVKTDGAGQLGWASVPTGYAFSESSDRFFNVKDVAYGATGDGVTDDTVAIQAAIDACNTAGGGTVYFPIGTYVINGAQQTIGGGVTGQLTLPVHPRTAGGTGGPMPVIRLLGACAPNQQYGPIAVDPTAKLTRIKSTLTTGSGGALLAGWGGGVDVTHTRIDLRIENIEFEMPSNPTHTCLDLHYVNNVTIENCVVNAGDGQGVVSPATLVEPTTATSVGVKMPDRQCGAHNGGRELTVRGFYRGMEISEHESWYGKVFLLGCKEGVYVKDMRKISTFQHLMFHQVPKCIIMATGSVTGNLLAWVQNETTLTGSTWYAPVSDIEDTDNNLFGHVIMLRDETDDGSYRAPTVVDGGAGTVGTPCNVQDIRSAYFRDRKDNTIFWSRAQNTQVVSPASGNSHAVNLDLTNGNHWAINMTSATATAQVTINAFDDDERWWAGTIRVTGHAVTGQDITFLKGTDVATVTWLGTEPTWNDSGNVNKSIMISYRYDNGTIFLSASETETVSF